MGWNSNASAMRRLTLQCGSNVQGGTALFHKIEWWHGNVAAIYTVSRGIGQQSMGWQISEAAMCLVAWPGGMYKLAWQHGNDAWGDMGEKKECQGYHGFVTSHIAASFLRQYTLCTLMPHCTTNATLHNDAPIAMATRPMLQK